MPSKNKGSWRQFDSKRGGGDGDGTKIKSIIISAFFGLTAIISFIIIVLSFSQVTDHGKFPWDTVSICGNDSTKLPVRYLIPQVKFPPPVPTEPPPTEAPTPAPTTPPPPPVTPAPTTAPPATTAPTTAPPVTDAPTEAPTEAPTSKPARSLRASYNWTDSYLNKHTVSCPWPANNSALRILAHILGLATCITFFWLVMRQEVWQAFWVVLFASLFLVVFIFIMFVRDANTLANSKKYCIEQAKEMTTNRLDINPEHFEIKCNLSPEIAVAVLNVVWLLWVPNAALLYIYVKKWKVVIYS